MAFYREIPRKTRFKKWTLSFPVSYEETSFAIWKVEVTQTSASTVSVKQLYLAERTMNETYVALNNIECHATMKWLNQGVDGYGQYNPPILSFDINPDGTVDFYNNDYTYTYPKSLSGIAYYPSGEEINSSVSLNGRNTYATLNTLTDEAYITRVRGNLNGGTSVDFTRSGNRFSYKLAIAPGNDGGRAFSISRLPSSVNIEYL